MALLPWDAEVFGFPVADFRPGDRGAIGAHRPAFAQRLSQWAGQRQVELVGCRHSPSEVNLSALLDECRFRFVEVSLRADLAPLRANRLPAARIAVRLAAPEDHKALLRIAESAFDSGRYHGDPRVPRALANARYRFWLDNALSRPGPGTRVFALGAAGPAMGFFHVEIEEASADLRLAAVDPAGNAGIAAFSLYSGVLQALACLGVQRVTARLTATNTPVVSLYAALGFRFTEPQVVRHWHPVIAPHLVTLEPATAALTREHGQSPAR